MGRFDRYQALNEGETDKPSWPMAIGWAIGFFSTLPAGPPQVRNPHARDVFSFLFVGVMFAVIWSAVATLMLVIPNEEVGTLITAAGVMSIDILLTGGMHADGLADVADGLAAKRSGSDVKRAMEDSAVGAVGGAYLVVAYIVRFALLTAAIYAMAPFGATVLMIGLAPLVGRGLAGMALRSVAPSEGGLSDPLRSVIPFNGALLMLVITAALGVGAANLLHFPLLMVLAIMGIATASALYLINRVSKTLDGIGGGDICGTGIVVAEAMVCLGLALSGPYLY
ncbi:adenosylcobinamide-GDP ribazoletransferase [Stomatohabitans albus]|uniref:adenosylcobinamide-GDP ribazoletransferase n=1 Tax=Stomatohabitans albus TaxID=3110766 RepID=UPI00300D9912